MDYDNIGRMTTTALTLCIVISLPAVLVAAVIGLLVSFVQAVTSLQDSSISHSIKLVAVAVTDSGRPLPRVGGLKVSEIKGEDGLR